MASDLRLEKSADGNTISVGSPGSGPWFVIPIAAVPALAGVAGLHWSEDLPGWAIVGAVILVGLGSAGMTMWAIATVAELELRGLITDVWRPEIRRAPPARHYRDTPGGPTLKAGGRTWPLGMLRRVDVGERAEERTLYLVLDDEVLRVLTPGAGPELVEVARELSEAVGVPYACKPDRQWQSETSGPVLLVLVPLAATVGGSLLALKLALSPGLFPAAPVGLATILFPVAWCYSIASVTRRILLPAGRAYVRERFEIEPRA